MTFDTSKTTPGNTSLILALFYNDNKYQVQKYYFKYLALYKLKIK